jgi:hypothetical protein
MDSPTFTRRTALARAALAALAVSVPDVLRGVPAEAAGGPRHCLPARDRFGAVAVFPDCSFAAFSPDGARLACTTPGGVEVRPRHGGAAVGVAGPGFSAVGQPWHPDGTVLLASGPGGAFAPAEAPFALRADGSGGTRLLGELPGRSRGLAFSPDGRRVALTYLDGFVHRPVLADWAGGAEPRAERPRALLPFEPASEPDTGRMLNGLAWHETRGFTPDGLGLVIASDRGGGLLNANVHVLDLASGRIRHVTRDDGWVEGAAVGPGETLFYGSTRAREPSLLTLVTGPRMPTLLGFAATPALHDALAARFLAPVGNGDVLAADARTGLRARVVKRREVVARAAGAGRAAERDARVRVCSVSPDGTELAVAIEWAGGQAVVILRRARGAVPARPRVSETPVPPTAAELGGARLPLLGDSRPAFSRTLRGRYSGEVDLLADGNLERGTFEARMREFGHDGIAAFDGTIRFELDAGRARHDADVRRVRGSDAGESDRGAYRAALAIDDTGATGFVESRWPRSSGLLRAVASGGPLEPEGRLRAARGPGRDVTGSEPCRRPRRRRRAR